MWAPIRLVGHVNYERSPKFRCRDVVFSVPRKHDREKPLTRLERSAFQSIPALFSTRMGRHGRRLGEQQRAIARVPEYSELLQRKTCALRYATIKRTFSSGGGRLASQRLCSRYSS